MKDRFIKFCKKSTVKELNDFQKRIETLEPRIERDTDILHNFVKELADISDGIQTKKELFEGQSFSKYGDEYDALLKIDKILSLEISGNNLFVFTDILYVVDPRSRLTHKIGNMKISIPINGRGSVRWQNLDTRYSRPAPHVYDTGFACLGNAEETFGDLISNYEFAAVAMLAISFVEEVNIHDTFGRSITNWPIALRRKTKAGGKDRNIFMRVFGRIFPVFR